MNDDLNAKNDGLKNNVFDFNDFFFLNTSLI